MKEELIQKLGIFTNLLRTKTNKRTRDCFTFKSPHFRLNHPEASPALRKEIYEFYEKYFGGYIRFKHWSSLQSLVYFKEGFEEKLDKVIKDLEKLNTTAITMQEGKTYQLEEDYRVPYSGCVILKGSVVELLHKGRGWDNKSIIMVRKGVVQEIKSSNTVYENSILNKSFWKASYDPYNNTNTLLATEIN